MDLTHSTPDNGKPKQEELDTAPIDNEYEDYVVGIFSKNEGEIIETDSLEYVLDVLNSLMNIPHRATPINIDEETAAELSHYYFLTKCFYQLCNKDYEEELFSFKFKLVGKIEENKLTIKEINLQLTPKFDLAIDRQKIVDTLAVLLHYNDGYPVNAIYFYTDSVILTEGFPTLEEVRESSRFTKEKAAKEITEEDQNIRIINRRVNLHNIVEESVQVFVDPSFARPNFDGSMQTIIVTEESQYREVIYQSIFAASKGNRQLFGFGSASDKALDYVEENYKHELLHKKQADELNLCQTFLCVNIVSKDKSLRVWPSVRIVSWNPGVTQDEADLATIKIILAPVILGDSMLSVDDIENFNNIYKETSQSNSHLEIITYLKQHKGRLEKYFSDIYATIDNQIS